MTDTRPTPPRPDGAPVTVVFLIAIVFAAMLAYLSTAPTPTPRLVCQDDARPSLCVRQ